MADWACCYTHPQAEHWAAANLRQAGYRVYVPLITVRVRDRATRSLFHQVERPAFARYVLVQHSDPEPWTPIAYLPGVAKLLTMDGKPTHLNAGAVEALQAALATPASGKPPELPWRPGAALRWLRGPFQGLDAIALDPGRTFTRVSAVMLGGIRTIRVSNHDLALR